MILALILMSTATLIFLMYLNCIQPRMSKATIIVILIGATMIYGWTMGYVVMDSENKDKLKLPEDDLVLLETKIIEYEQKLGKYEQFFKDNSSLFEWGK